MKALYFNEGGNIDHLILGEIDKPEIKDDELLIKVHATGMNPSDYQTIEYMGIQDKPVILGLDIAGEVVECGKDVKDFKRGDRVVYLREVLNSYGGYAEYAKTPAKFVSKIPDQIEYTQAAVLPGAGMTAYHIMYDRFHLSAGKTIFIQGGAGGVGSYAIQIAKKEGLKVITTCLGRDIDYVKELGADIAIDFQQEDAYKRVMMETNNQGVDYILSMINSTLATKDLTVARFNCEIAVTAGLPDLSSWKFYEKSLTIHEIALGLFLTYPDDEMNKVPVRLLNSLAKKIDKKEIKVPKTTIINLEEVPAYLKKIKNGEISGKVVVRI